MSHTPKQIEGNKEKGKREMKKKKKVVVVVLCWNRAIDLCLSASENDTRLKLSEYAEARKLFVSRYGHVL